MDNLTATILAAQKAGMSYGQYVALNGTVNAPKPKKKPKAVPTRKCKECGKVFQAIGHKSVALYCSAECQITHSSREQNKRYYEKKKAGLLPKVKPSAMICPECGKEFSPVGKKHNVVYCSSDCQRTHNRKTIIERYHDRKKGNNNECL